MAIWRLQANRFLLQFDTLNYIIYISALLSDMIFSSIYMSINSLKFNSKKLN